ncbi:phage holin family protein [Hymenobacter psychrotolerans]|uniref:Phage-related holin (Lysis protein) n=1 Tax=Hymenobacter psychrotolerans DSM 18569 TaxID=1121959 RepID=A0A1M7E7Q0_9BACT|nr:phage holin family protein [Hymenobacter psychrotolerans]SHL87792.1 Phage-related holin (Lysis protein) [Hymenobacter psychrotolerans DSM 18569]
MHPLLPPALEKAAQLFQKYIFNDWSALGFLMVLFLIDTLLGMARSFKQGRFHSRGMRQMFTKLRDYGVGIVVAHVFSSIEIDGSRVPWADYMSLGVKFTIYLFILIIEAKSIDENLRGLGGMGLPMPKFLRQGMTDWEETGSFRSKVPPEELAPAAPEPMLESELPPLPAPPALREVSI